MAVYKFKVVVEDNDDIYREIDILSNQTFEDFHNIIQDAFKFDKKHAASFFVSDDYWRKDQEITLRQIDLELDAEEIKLGVTPKKMMSATKIAKFIEQPRQRFMYVFDPAVKWAFCIELMKILADNPKQVFPTITKSIGTAPKQYKVSKIIKDDLDSDGEPNLLLDDDVVDESEIYKSIKNDTNAIDEGDLNHLEGEEGDADNVEENEFTEDNEMDEDGELSDDGGGYHDEEH